MIDTSETSDRRRRRPDTTKTPIRRTPRARRISTLVALLTLLASPAYAYLDPGTGSMILQLILGGVAGTMVVVKLYWQRIKQLLGLATAEESKPDNVSASDAD